MEFQPIRQMQLHKSQLLSPKSTSFPLVAPQTQNVQEMSSTTYYLTQNKPKKSRALLVTNAQQQNSLREKSQHNKDLASGQTSPKFATTNANVTVNQRSEYEPQARRGSKFKKRHVSNVADRIHSNTMKNMALIQRQIQANTNMTKNRLAVGQKVSGASMQQLPSVRSQTVHNHSRKPYYANQNLENKRNTAVGGNREKLIHHHHNRSGEADSSSIVEDFLRNTQLDNHRHGDSAGINFEPLGLGIQHSNRKPKQSGTSNGEYDSTMMTNFYSNNQASKIQDQRRKVYSSQMDYNGIEFLEGSNSQISSEYVPDKGLITKDMISMTTNSQRKRNQIDLSMQQQASATDRIETTDQNQSIGQRSSDAQLQQQQALRSNSIAYKIIQEDSFLDSNFDLAGGASITMTPGQATNPTQGLYNNSLFAPTELDGKRLGNNISEIQNSRITEESKSLIQSAGGAHQKMKVQDVSTILSQTSAITASKLGRMECGKCHLWKRINQECRNFAKRVNYKDLKSVFKYIEELANIESIMKMTPEFSRSLIQLRDNFRCQYEEEKQELEARIFKLENQVKDKQSLADKYRSDFEEVQKKYKNIHDFIYESRTVTIKKDDLHKKFLEDVTIQDEVLDEALDLQGKQKYSALDLELHDLRDAVDSQREHQIKTLKYLHDKVVNEKRNSQFHMRVEDIFDREAAMQQESVRSFMKSHFKCGLDPCAMVFDKATMTAENMISSGRTYPNAAERKKADVAAKNQENITCVKIENSLLCQQNTELKQDIRDLRDYQKGIERKLSFFQDLDVEKVRRAQEEYNKVVSENLKIKESLTKGDAQRSTLMKDNKRMALYEEHYKLGVQTSLEFNTDILKMLKELRREITSEETDTENLELNVTTDRMVKNGCDAIITGPAPGSKTVNNMFKRYIEDQRYTIIQAIDIMQRVVKIAYSLNRPLLATEQSLEEVFRKQRNEAFGEVQVRFDAQLHEIEISHQKTKDQLDEKVEELSSELKEQTKKANQANEALRRFKERAAQQQSPAKPSKAARKPDSLSVSQPSKAQADQVMSPTSSKSDKEASSPQPRARAPPPKKAARPAGMQRQQTNRTPEPTAVKKPGQREGLKRGSLIVGKKTIAPTVPKKSSKPKIESVQDVDEESSNQSSLQTGKHETIKETKSNVSNITEELSQEIATSGDESKVEKRKQSVPLPTASQWKDSNDDSYEVSSKTSGKQSANVKKISSISVASVQTSREVDKNQLETQQSKSTFKPFEMDQPSNEKSKKNIQTPKSSTQAKDLGSVGDYPSTTTRLNAQGINDFTSPLLENAKTRSMHQQATSEASSEGMVLAAKNLLPTPKNNVTERDPNASPIAQGLGDYAIGTSRNEQHTQVNSKSLQESKKSMNRVVFEIDGIKLQENDPEERERRQKELRELTAKFKENPHDEEIKKEYFRVLKLQYGETDSPAPKHPYSGPKRKSQIYSSRSISPFGVPDPHGHFQNLAKIFNVNAFNVFNVGSDRFEKQQKEYKPPAQLEVPKLSSIQANKVEVLGSSTSKNRLKHLLYVNSKNIQCELLKETPQPPKKTFVDKKTQVNIRGPNEESYASPSPSKKRQKQFTSKKSATQAIVSSKESTARLPNRYLNLQDQTAGYVGPSRIFDQTISQEDRASRKQIVHQGIPGQMNQKLMPNDSEHALDGGLWVQNAFIPAQSQRRIQQPQQMERSRRSPLKQRQNSELCSSNAQNSMRASSGVNFLFQPLLNNTEKKLPVKVLEEHRSSSQHMVQRRRDRTLNFRKEESVMLEVRQMKREHKYRSLSQDPDPDAESYQD